MIKDNSLLANCMSVQLIPDINIIEKGFSNSRSQKHTDELYNPKVIEQTGFLGYCMHAWQQY